MAYTGQTLQQGPTPVIPALRALIVSSLLLQAAAARAAMTCAAPPFDDDPRIASVVERTLDAIRGFDGLEATLNATLGGICISDHLHVARGYFEPDTRRIVLAPELEGGLLQAVMVHELRHAEQYAQGLCPSLSLGMKDYAQAVFAMEADASVTNLVVASRLKADGDPAMWTALENWPMQSDIAEVFAATLAEDGDLALAAHAAFDAWFDGEVRTHAYYVASCLDYLDQTEKAHLLPQYDRVAPDFLTRLCTLPDGTRYACDLPGE